MKLNNLELFGDQFSPQLIGDNYIETISKEGFVIREVDIGDITFRGGQREGVHRWFRLTPSYSPNLVRYFLKEFKATSKDIIFDPFSGRGTTVIECQKNYFNSFAIELNPLFQKIGQYSLKFNSAKIELFDSFLNDLSIKIRENKRKSLSVILKTYEITAPNIHDVFRWWKEDVLKDLLISRELAYESKFGEIKNFLWIALNMSSLECANIHRNHPTISFDDDHTREINVFNDLFKRISEIKEDLDQLKDFKLSSNNAIYQGDSVRLCETFNNLKNKSKPSIVITSPPYPNRFSYIHQTRPQLHFMEIIKDRSEATELDLKAIGGTWGRATSILMKDLIVPSDELLEILNYFEELSAKSILMCNYATKYFLDIDKHLEDLRKLVGKKFRGAYVVGNSRLSGVEIHTECILGKILERHGFKVTEIVVFRKRGGRRKLYETAVCFTT